MPTDHDRQLEAARPGARDLSKTPLVKGGQGRTDAEIEADADFAFALWLMAAVLVIGLAAIVALLWWAS